MAEFFTDNDRHYMKTVLELARKGQGSTSPNPMVGAVVVRDGRIVGQGYHKKAGTAHAEIIALDQAGMLAEGSTLYVSLEPCCHYGKTPPCTSRIIKDKVSRVIAAMLDPNPLVGGKGIAILKEAGIDVKTGLLEKDAMHLNEFFIKYITTGIPFVTIKSALTMNGKITAKSSDSQWISNTASRQYVHELRSYYDAVLIGINTVIADNPRLTCRISGAEESSPFRVVLDNYCRIPLQSHLVTDSFSSKTIIAVSSGADLVKIKQLEERGIRIIKMDSGQINCATLLKKLGEIGIVSLLVEGGGHVNASFIEQGLADKVILFIAPKLFSPNNDTGFFEGHKADTRGDVFSFRVQNIKQFDDDVMIEYYKI